MLVGTHDNPPTGPVKCNSLSSLDLNTFLQYFYADGGHFPSSVSKMHPLRLRHLVVLRPGPAVTVAIALPLPLPSPGNLVWHYENDRCQPEGRGKRRDKENNEIPELMLCSRYSSAPTSSDCVFEPYLDVMKLIHLGR